VTHPPNSPSRPTDTPDRRIRRAWWIFATAFFVLGLISVLRVAVDPRPIDWALLGLVFVVGYAAIRHREAVSVLETGRREEAESFARILSSLSRSVSPDAILSAIVTELADATGADHIVIARRRADARVLEATLVSARPGVPDSTTLMPIADLEDPPAVEGESLRREPIAVPVATPVVADVVESVPLGAARVTSLPGGGIRTRFDELTARIAAAGSAPGSPAPPAVGGAPGGGRAVGTQLVAERIATRARAVFGLTDTLAAPLTSDHEVVGAIVLSRRTAGPWSATTRRILNGAAIEASAALARAYSLRAAEAKASTDALTGLPNRRYFDEFCGLLARRRRSGDAVGVLMIDIDRFKRLNDTFGHATGDEVLRAVGGAIVSAVREDDVPARYGGEEFVVLLRNPTPEVALEVGQRVRAAVGSLDLRKLGVGRVSVSVGVAVARQVDQPIPELIAEADRALYRAKRGGRDRVIAA
jgi:diguanylate cyclase (GGDEF)-like protein